MGSGRSFIVERAYTGAVSANAAEETPNPQSTPQPPHAPFVVHGSDDLGRRQPVLRQRSVGVCAGVLPRHRPRRDTATRPPGKRHALSLRRTPPQRERPLLGELCEVLDISGGIVHVRRSAIEALRIVAELAKAAVAVKAQDSAHATSAVIVIDVLGSRFLADRAHIALMPNQILDL
jgi:hypothetical protein